MADQPHVTEDVDLARLQTIYDESISEHDHAPATRFVDAAEQIDWTRKAPTIIHHAVQMALSLDAVRYARKLANRGHELYPDDAELERTARVIAPPRVLERELPASPGIGASIQWLQQHQGEYAGQWVALKNGELLGTAETREHLKEQIGPITSEDRVLITRMG